MKWLLLRGLVRETRHWGSFPDFFEKQLRAFDETAEVFTLDFPGFGSEAAKLSPATVSGIVDDLRARWTQLAPNEKWNFFAVSLGGMVALNWVSRYPKDFEKLVLVNSSLRDLSPFHHRLRPQNYAQILGIFFNADVASREEIVLSITTNLKNHEIKNLAKTYASFAVPTRRRDAIAQLYAAAIFKAPSRIPIPILILASEKDQLVSAKCSTQIAEKFGSPIYYHSDANHDLPIDAPEWVTEKVLAWAHSAAD